MKRNSIKQKAINLMLSGSFEEYVLLLKQLSLAKI